MKSSGGHLQGVLRPNREKIQHSGLGRCIKQSGLRVGVLVSDHHPNCSAVTGCYSTLDQFTLLKRCIFETPNVRHRAVSSALALKNPCYHNVITLKIN